MCVCYNGRIMKIKLKVREVAESKGIDNPFALSQKSGLNYAIAYRLWHAEQRRLDLTTLEKLCEALKAKPGQFFEYGPDE
jgi:DNA-binding Xre family transcriptional regulator